MEVTAPSPEIVHHTTSHKKNTFFVFCFQKCVNIFFNISCDLNIESNMCGKNLMGLMLKKHFATCSCISEMVEDWKLYHFILFFQSFIASPPVPTFVAGRYMRGILCNSKRFNPRQITLPLIIVW